MLDSDYLTAVVKHFRRVAIECGCIEADDDLARNLIRYAESMEARTMTGGTKKQVHISKYRLLAGKNRLSRIKTVLFLAN